MGYKFKLLDYVQYVRQNHNDFDTVFDLGQITGRFQTESGENKYFVSARIQSFYEDELQHTPVSFDIYVSYNPILGFKTELIKGKKLMKRAEDILYKSVVKITDVDPEIHLNLFWDVNPESPLIVDVTEYLVKLYTPAPVGNIGVN